MLCEPLQPGVLCLARPSPDPPGVSEGCLGGTIPVSPSSPWKRGVTRPSPVGWVTRLRSVALLGWPGPRQSWAAARSAPFLRALSGEHRFVLDEDSYLVPELDGVRILSRTSHEFLHEIPGEMSSG